MLVLDVTYVCYDMPSVVWLTFCMYFEFGDCRYRKNDMLPVVPHFVLRRRVALFHSLEHIFNKSHLGISS